MLLHWMAEQQEKLNGRLYGAHVSHLCFFGLAQSDENIHQQRHRVSQTVPFGLESQTIGPSHVSSISSGLQALLLLIIEPYTDLQNEHHYALHQAQRVYARHHPQKPPARAQPSRRLQTSMRLSRLAFAQGQRRKYCCVPTCQRHEGDQEVVLL